MNRRIVMLSLLAAAFTASASGQTPVRSEQDTLIQLERDWDEAFHRNDDKFIAPILADEFMVTYGDGSRGDRAKELEIAKVFQQAVESSTLDEFTVKIYRDTAVVWFTQHLVGTSQGQKLALTFHYIDVFVFRDGRWQCVASQSTRVQD